MSERIPSEVTRVTGDRNIRWFGYRDAGGRNHSKAAHIFMRRAGSKLRRQWERREIEREMAMRE